MSVWNKVDRAAFEKDLITLHSTSPIQDPANLPALVPHPRDGDGTSTLKDAIDAITERQLAEDFAFLASLTTNARDVAAATVHHEQEPDRLCVSVSANEGVGTEARRLLEKLTSTLKQRASSFYSRRDSERCFLDAVVEAHRNRILTRLGSRKARCERLPADFGLVGRINALLSNIRRTHASGSASGAVSLLIKQLEAFESSVRLTEEAAPGSVGEFESIRSLLQAAFALTASRHSLVQRVQEAGVRTVNERSKETRALTGLATYVRICEYVVRAARRHKRWFRNIELNVVQADLPTMWQGKKLFVHAEIQLVVHFELFPVAAPRFVGASKKPCFLCHSFVRAHGRYGMRQSHGEVFRQWTIPDKPDFNQEAREKLAEALEQTAQDVKNALKAPRLVQVGKPYFHPCQTVSKLLVDQLRNSSKSTVVSVVSVISTGRESEAAYPSIDGKVDEAFYGEDTEDAIQSLTLEESDASKDPDVFEETITTAASPTYRNDDVELFFEFEPRSRRDANNGTPAVKTLAGVCRVRKVSRSLDIQGEVIDIARLTSSVFTMRSEMVSGPVRFVLLLGSAKYEVELRWR